MKTLKNVMRVVTVALIFISAVHAQDRHSRTQQSEDRMKVLSTRLSLSADQETKIKAIMKENREKMKELREANKESSKERKRTVFASQMKSTDDKINALLDAKQQEQYKLYKEEMKAERKKKMQDKRMTHEDDSY